MKRFYKLVSAGKDNCVELDGKPVKTSLGHVLTAPNEKIALVMTEEWRVQEDTILPETMPVTQIISTALDTNDDMRTEITDRLLKYLDTDLLCYRAETPRDLAQKQAEQWDKWLTWFNDKHGEVLRTTTGLSALVQPSSALESIKKYIEGLDTCRFTLFQIITNLSGSTVLALAFMDQAITIDELYDAVTIEERHKADIYDEDKYGADPHQNKIFSAMKRDFEAGSRILDLL